MSALPMSRFLLLFLLLNNLWKKTLAKSIPDLGAIEVLIKVQVFDNSDLSPLAGAAVEIYGNQSTLASSKAGSDGVVMATFVYRPGTRVIVTAAKQGYVTNSAPWHANRVPLYASVSLYLLPQRPATLILYDDVVQMLLGSPGGRIQPWVQFQRKAIPLSLNSSYTNLVAMLTAAKSQYEMGGFPYPLGREGNGTAGDGGWVELTAVGAVSTRLSTRDGSTLHVSDPVHVSVPLPPDTPLKGATSVPVWRFEASTGLWIRNGTGYIKKEGVQMIWSFVAPQLGYWLAAFPSSSGLALNPSGLRDITTYHTIFLLAILGSLALLVLILLCLLLYYCRRRCLKPRQQHRKMHVASTLEALKQDQGTSTSHLNLISSSRIESASSNGNLDAGKADLSSREEYFRHIPTQKVRQSTVNVDVAARHGESFPMKVTHSTETNNLDAPRRDDRHHFHIANDNRAYSSDPPSPPSFSCHYQDPGHNGRPPEYSMSQASEPMVRPTSLNTQPGQLIFCSSMDQMKESMYRSVVPTLVIPAHYMQLSTDFSGVEQALEQQQQQQHDREGIQVSVTLPRQTASHQQQQGLQQQITGQQGEPSGSVRIPVLFDDSTMAQMNGELQALTEKKLLELGVKPHPRAWFVSLDGRSNSLVRHSYIELGNERGASGSESRLEMRDGRPQPRKVKEERSGGGERKGHGGKAYSKLACMDDTEPSSSDSRTGMCSPEDNSLTPLLDEAPEPRGATFPRPSRSRGNSSRSADSENRRGSVTSPEENIEVDDKDDEGENKKSPWQKREERPLMVFNVK
nr:protein FAM171A2-like isoform X2 [Paramormyrops kingsleyae]